MKEIIERGLALAPRTILGRNLALVPSSRGGYMTVQFIAPYTLNCPCPAFKFSKVKVNDHPLCKHVVAALYVRWLFAGMVGSFESELSKLAPIPIIQFDRGGKDG